MYSALRLAVQIEKRLYASIIFIMRDVLCIIILWWCGHKRPRKGTARKLLDVAVPKCGPFFLRHEISKF
jgi:hypothetical protein